MGGAALLMAELRRPGTFAGLWLYEPIVFPPLEGGGHRENPMADAARRRRPLVRRPRGRLRQLRGQAAARRARPDGAAGLRRPRPARTRPDGDGVELTCAPEVEARVFESGLMHDTFDHLGEVACPVTIAASGDAGVGPAQFGPAMADALPHGRLERHPS